MARENGSVTAEPEEEEERERERGREKKGRLGTHDASLWPFGSLMVVRHASLCVPSVPFPLCPTYLSLFVYLSLHSRPPHSGAPFARLESRSPTIREPLRRRKGLLLSRRNFG